MADVFISYKSERRAAARHLAEILEAHGFSVWFDYALVPGRNFGAAIERELRAAKAVVVLWCSMSRDSEWVKEEATLAKRLGLIVPVLVECCDPPLGFLNDDYVDLSRWDGDPGTRLLDRLLDRIEVLVGRESAIARKRVAELHGTWVNHGRRRFVDFQREASRDIADTERRLPSSSRPENVPIAVPAMQSDGPVHDNAFWEGQWQRYGASENLSALRDIADKAPRLFANQAVARVAYIEAQQSKPSDMGEARAR